MMQYRPFSPVDIRFSTMRGFLEQPSFFADKRLLVVASEGTLIRLKEHAGAGHLINNKNNRFISNIRPNPSVEDVIEVLTLLERKDKYDCILAIGGGSSIDLAKSISALRGFTDTHGADYDVIVEAIEKKLFFYKSEPADIIAVPTTAGTGSEVTRWATVWDFKNKKKLSVEHCGCFPKAAFIIPELTLSMPAKLTLSTGLDALCHAMEAFWAASRNLLSQALAINSIKRIKTALPAALENKDCLKAREDMCMGSLLAGLAFSITKTTASHSISYPLTLNHGVEHGFAAALTIAQVMDKNANAVPEVADIAGVFGGNGGFAAWLSGVTRGIQDLKLSAFGIAENNIDSIVQGAFTLGRMDNNPVSIDKETVKYILKNIL